ncbi:DnaJ-domain-containing protein [Setomelanomma holmii]|uniref:DnaJ-domain-containing protein n=1 Tax=Setomelanomma holmii TaxID=210430 RepID=A0A9P4LLC6_9PLEO|nr:DnaJ-domain-containing protein [Setomelanomma holmii]
MSTATFYATLGLLPTAAPEIIRATYKALCLIYHPDKTLHLSSDERASHAAVFRDVQEAYDVLCNPSLKVSYDAELARHVHKVDKNRSTFHRSSSSHSTSASTSSPSRRKPVQLTTPEEKASMRAKVRQSLEHLRQTRAVRNAEDEKLDIATLKNLAQIWRDLEQENDTNPALKSHCAIRIYEYGRKISQRPQQHGQWLAYLSAAKQTPVTPVNQQRSHIPDNSKKLNASLVKSSASGFKTGRPGVKDPSTTAASPVPTSRGSTRAEERKRAEGERAAEAAARAQARLHDKAQREAAKQAHIEKKAAAESQSQPSSPEKCRAYRKGSS